MFGDLLGNVQKQQAEMQQKLAEITVNADAGDGAVQVTAGADMSIRNIKIDPEKVDFSDREQLEDLLVVAVNEALDLAKQTAAAETNKLLQGMIPGGLDGLFK